MENQHTVPGQTSLPGASPRNLVQHLNTPAPESDNNRLLGIIASYQKHIGKTLWIMTLLVWAMSWLYAGVHQTWLLALVVGGSLTACCCPPALLRMHPTGYLFVMLMK